CARACGPKSRPRRAARSASPARRGSCRPDGLDAQPVEACVDVHAREAGREIALLDALEARLLVEAVCGTELLGGPEIDVVDAALRGMLQQARQQPGSEAVRRPAIGLLHEHLAQRALPIADVDESDRADDIGRVERDPELAAVALIETENVM